MHTNLDCNLQTDAVFLDYAKAFDKVSNQCLQLKLSPLNLHPDIVKWLEQFLTNRTQYVLKNSQ